jgi:hypothetical protein
MPPRIPTMSALLAAALVAVTVPVTLAQGASPAADVSLAARLPATVGGAPVEIVGGEDLGAWISALFAGEPHPEIDALETALAGQGLSPADVDTVTAWFGPEQDGQIMGFGIPGGDATPLADAITATYLIGVGDLQRTEREVGDRAVTFLSEGPLDAAAYPFAVLPDAGVLWIVNAEIARIIEGIEALLAVSAGRAPGNTRTAPPPPAEIGPATWFGTMRETLTWAKGRYVGETTTAFRGTWERVDDEGMSYCPDGPCAAYLPMGEVEWTFESAAPGPPSCRNRQSGSVSAGEVVIPQDQMLFLAPADSDHLRYWGSGTLFVPPQECPGWEGIRSPGAFFDVPRADDEDHEFADLVGDPRPLCAAYDWRMERDASQLTGTCWRYDEPGYEQRFDWDLRDVDPE